MFDFKKRLSELQEKMRVDCTVIAQVSHTDANAYYYSGSTEPFLAYVTKDYSVAFTAERRDFPQFDETHEWKKAREFYKQFFRKEKVKSAGLDFSSEASRVGFRLLEGKRKVKVKSIAMELEDLRAIKDPQELKLLRKAQDATKKAVEETSRKGFRGKTEHEIAGLLEYSSRKNGFALDSFPPIVATAPKNAIPHAIPSNERVTDMVLIDCGATCEQYHGDYTTTRYEGRNKEIKDAVEAVWESKKAAEKLCKVGASGKKIAAKAVEVIREYGFGKYSHKKTGLALGHSVGLKVHDGFRIEEVKLRKGMAFTIEPGIYVPGRFGVRFEDVVFL